MKDFITTHWPKLALIIAYLIVALAFIRVDYIEDESIRLWDIHVLGGYTITYIYDATEGPVFWLTEQGRTIIRWPSYKPKPTPPPYGLQNA